MANENAVPSTGLDRQDVSDLVSFMMGESSTPPAALSRVMTNLYQKMQMSLGYNVAGNTQRMVQLQKFIADAEAELFDPSSVQTMSKEDLLDAYKSATKTLGEMNELTRRFLAQNKDTFGRPQTAQEQLASKLLTLSPEKLESIMSIVEAEEQMASTPNDSLDIL